MSWTREALVKKSEPANRAAPIQSADDPSAATAVAV
jgi:hypothetical protein